jgi:hypothetical protein
MKLIGKVVTLKIESITITLSKEMETFATEVYWLADQQRSERKSPKDTEKVTNIGNARNVREANC